MRWRQEFMAEVFESLLRLGLRACPVCDSAESLSMSPYPAILVDGEFPLDPDTLPEDEGGDLTFAVRIECTTCGHLMLFNAQRYRSGDAKIIEFEITEDGMTEEGRPLQKRIESLYRVWPQSESNSTRSSRRRTAPCGGTALHEGRREVAAPAW